MRHYNTAQALLLFRDKLNLTVMFVVQLCLSHVDDFSLNRWREGERGVKTKGHLV